MELMNLMPGVQSSAEAMDAGRVALDLIAQNIANAQTTRDVDGEPYRRKEVLFESYMREGRDGELLGRGLRIGSIREDPTPGEAIYAPHHPHAGPDGMLRLPNVNMAMEMVDLISTSRSYEANLSVVRTARQMAQQTLNIGK